LETLRHPPHKPPPVGVATHRLRTAALYAMLWN